MEEQFSLKRLSNIYSEEDLTSLDYHNDSNQHQQQSNDINDHNEVFSSPTMSRKEYNHTNGTDSFQYPANGIDANYLDTHYSDHSIQNRNTSNTSSTSSLGEDGLPKKKIIVYKKVIKKVIHKRKSTDSSR